MTTTITPNEAEKVVLQIAMKNILCATDFSSVSDGALAYAAAIARSRASKLYIVHVLPEEAPPQIPLEPLPASMDRERVEANESMDVVRAGKCLTGIAHEEIVERGPIEDVISDLIEKNEIDLLVVGTHGRGGLNKVLLGSTAEQLFRTAACPVLTVGANVPEPPATDTLFPTVLFPTDFSDASLAALTYAHSIVKEKPTTHLILLHAITPKAVPPHPSWQGVVTLSEKRQLESMDATRRLRAIVPDDEVPGGVDYLVSFGAAPQVLEDAIVRFQPDLVIMGLRKLAEPRAAAHFYWSTAHHLVSRAQCPILTIRY